MARAKYLIDTNTLINYLAGRLPDAGMAKMEVLITSSSEISIISKIELLGFNTNKKNSELLSDFISEMIIVGLTSEIVEETILIRKNHSIKLPDAIIAATAITQNIVLITRNVSDFKSISKLETLNPHAIT